MIDEEEKPRLIPKAFRASIDESDAKGFALLEKNDEIQKKLKEDSDLIVADTPKARERAKARITADSLLNVIKTRDLTESERERLSEAYATLGFYFAAMKMTDDGVKAEIYQKIRVAFERDDSIWCKHGEQHRFIKEYVFDVVTETERPLIACAVCQFWNVKDAPDNLIEASKRRAAVRQATKGMSMSQVKNYLENSRLKNIR